MVQGSEFLLSLDHDSYPPSRRHAHSDVDLEKAAKAIEKAVDPDVVHDTPWRFKDFRHSTTRASFTSLRKGRTVAVLQGRSCVIVHQPSLTR